MNFFVGSIVFVIGSFASYAWFHPNWLVVAGAVVISAVVGKKIAES